MEAKTLAAFAAGVAVGWAGRSVLGSGRELVVRAVVLALEVRERLSQVAAEQVEWLEDSFAEGRARYATKKAEAPLDEDAHVVDARGRAA
jgi:hypothetical protein